DLMPIVDDPEEVIKIINDFYTQKKSELTPNYEL
ncbi:MAG: TIGR00730 family Rossman fold protein, partial [Bacteroidetes bacterium]